VSTQLAKHDLNQLFCVLYLRIAKDSTGKRLGVWRQRADCRALAKARGWTVVEEYVDNSISAYKKTKVRSASALMRWRTRF
jgi:hypothetical protein